MKFRDLKSIADLRIGMSIRARSGAIGKIKATNSGDPGGDPDGDETVTVAFDDRLAVVRFIEHPEWEIVV